MENEILFTEQQKFKQWWIWLILLAINGALIFGVLKQVIGNQQFGNNPHERQWPPGWNGTNPPIFLSIS